jgi:hypothetical protein
MSMAIGFSSLVGHRQQGRLAVTALCALLVGPPDPNHLDCGAVLQPRLRTIRSVSIPLAGICPRDPPDLASLPDSNHHHPRSALQRVGSAGWGRLLDRHPHMSTSIEDAADYRAKE